MKAAAKEVSKVTGGKLDVLINNAASVGTAPAPWDFDD